MRILILILSVFLIQVVTAQIITVKQDGTGDYTTIQEAVDASSDGDTVLVWPGTYYENIYYNGKNITVGSLTLTTGNTSYIKQTIINGNYNGSCIQIYNCQTNTTINGFTLEYGSGTLHGYISGGGAIIKYSSVNIYNCIISDNKANGYGGGIYLNNSQGFMSNVTITNNHAYDRGGGILLLQSSMEFDSINLCNIYLNYAARGTDIYKMGSPPLHIVVDTFTVESPDYYYLFSQWGYGYPQNDITYEIHKGKIQTVTKDLYVATNGNNQNNGITPEEPLKDIYYAFLKMASDSILPDTIHVANGLYFPSTGEKFPLSLKKYVSIQGASRDSTILDAENDIYILNGIVFADNYKISNLTLRNGNGNINSTYGYGTIMLFENHNATYENLFIVDNKGEIASSTSIRQSNNVIFKEVEFRNNIGGSTFRAGSNNITSRFSDTVVLINCNFISNYPDYNIPDGAFGGGAGIIGELSYPDSMTCIFYNCLFSHNHTQDYIWGFSNSLGLLNGGQAYVINCTFGNNTSDNSDGANIGVTYNSDLYIYNSILYNNYPAEIYMFTDDYGDCDLNVYYSLVEGGEEGIRILSPGNNIYYDPSNIDTDPMWDTTNYYPYGLSAGSPCINAGTLDLPEGIELPETDLAGNPRIYGSSIDMGAYEYGPWVGISEQNGKRQTANEKFLEVSPNPFSYSTYITYKVPESGHIVIQVYDMQGRIQTTLMDTRQMPGSGKFYWNGTGDNGMELPKGTYIINITINNREKDAVKVVKH